MYILFFTYFKITCLPVVQCTICCTWQIFCTGPGLYQSSWFESFLQFAGDKNSENLGFIFEHIKNFPLSSTYCQALLQSAQHLYEIKWKDPYPAPAYLWLINPEPGGPKTSVPDPWHFVVDPDPRIHASDWWIRILLFSSLTFKMLAKN